PVLELERDEGGRIMRISAAPPESIRAAAGVARQASAIARAAVDSALGLDRPAEPAAAAPAPPAQQADVRDRSGGEGRLDTWRARMRVRMILMPDTMLDHPPGEDPGPLNIEDGRPGLNGSTT